MEGTLEKLSRWIGRWNPRHVVLEMPGEEHGSAPRLLYYESKEQSVCEREALAPQSTRSADYRYRLAQQYFGAAGFHLAQHFSKQQ